MLSVIPKSSIASPAVTIVTAAWIVNIVTNDNPRFEDPHKIRFEIAKGCNKSEIISSREEAIKKAFKLLNKTNLLLITGKGHENYQIFKNIKKPFSDYKVVRSLL